MTLRRVRKYVVWNTPAAINSFCALGIFLWFLSSILSQQAKGPSSSLFTLSGLFNLYAEPKRACTTLWRMPPFWRCRPWWPLTPSTSWLPETPWRRPRRSVNGKTPSHILSGLTLEIKYSVDLAFGHRLEPWCYRPTTCWADTGSLTWRKSQLLVIVCLVLLGRSDHTDKRSLSFTAVWAHVSSVLFLHAGTLGWTPNAQAACFGNCNLQALLILSFAAKMLSHWFAWKQDKQRIPEEGEPAEMWPQTFVMEQRC